MSTLFAKGNIEMGEGKIDESYKRRTRRLLSIHCSLYDNKLDFCIKLAVRKRR